MSEGFTVEYPLDVSHGHYIVRSKHALTREFQGPYYEIELRIRPLDYDQMPCGREFAGKIRIPACQGWDAFRYGLENFWRTIIDGMVGKNRDG